MKRILLLCAVLAVLLSGCARTEPEKLILTDEIVTLPEGCIKYQITVCLPEGMIEAVSAPQDDCRMFEASDGSYYVVTQVHQGKKAEEVIREMTGSDAKQLGALCTQNMSMPEYRFSWCMEGENGMLTCTGIVVEDEVYCYSLEYCVQEQSAKACSAAHEQIMSSFGLAGNENF